MRTVKLMLLLTMILILGGCAGIKVNQDYDPGTDFSKFRAFTWKSETQPKTGDVRIDNPLLDTRIRKAIDMTLVNMGYRRVVQGPHDFKVGYSYAVRTTLDSSPVSVGTGFGIGGGNTFGGVGIGIPVVGQNYDEGLLVIDFTDFQHGNLLWRGTGTHRISMRSTPEEITVAVNALVEKVLAQIPISGKM